MLLIARRRRAGAGALPVPRRQAAQRRRQDLRHALLAASYDVLLGYAGIVSFAHVMFFGVGSYGVGLALYGLGPSWGALGARLGGGLGAATLLALAIGLFSLRVQAIFFAMVTLAVAYAFNVLASQLSSTHRRRGRPLVSGSRGAAAGLQARRAIFGVAINGRTLAYYLVLRRLRGAVPGAAAGGQFAVRPRAAGDPREPVARRSARLPHRLSPHAGDLPRRGRRGRGGRAQRDVAALRRARHRAQRFSIQIDVLVIVVIGGMGTLYGAVLGAALFVIARELSAGADRRALHGAADAGLPLLPACFIPTAGCCGSACCSSWRSISRRPASSARSAGRTRRSPSAPCRCARRAPHRLGAGRDCPIGVRRNA